VISLLALAAAPMLCHALLGGLSVPGTRRAERSHLLPQSALVVLAILPAALYLGVGVARGDYGFTADECSPTVEDGAPVVVVLARPETYADALSLREEAVAAGLDGTEVGFDECGRLRVAVGGVEDLESARALEALARPAGFAPVIEGA
jgi:hypothetical protein